MNVADNHVQLEHLLEEISEKHGMLQEALAGEEKIRQKQHHALEQRLQILTKQVDASAEKNSHVVDSLEKINHRLNSRLQDVISYCREGREYEDAEVSRRLVHLETTGRDSTEKHNRHIDALAGLTATMTALETVSLTDKQKWEKQNSLVAERLNILELQMGSTVEEQGSLERGNADLSHRFDQLRDDMNRELETREKHILTLTQHMEHAERFMNECAERQVHLCQESEAARALSVAVQKELAAEKQIWLKQQSSVEDRLRLFAKQTEESAENNAQVLGSLDTIKRELSSSLDQLHLSKQQEKEAREHEH